MAVAGLQRTPATHFLTLLVVSQPITAQEEASGRKRMEGEPGVIHPLASGAGRDGAGRGPRTHRTFTEEERKKEEFPRDIMRFFSAQG